MIATEYEPELIGKCFVAISNFADQAARRVVSETSLHKDFVLSIQNGIRFVVSELQTQYRQQQPRNLEAFLNSCLSCIQRIEYLCLLSSGVVYDGELASARDEARRYLLLAAGIRRKTLRRASSENIRTASFDSSSIGYEFASLELVDVETAKGVIRAICTASLGSEGKAPATASLQRFEKDKNSAPSRPSSIIQSLLVDVAPLAVRDWISQISSNGKREVSVEGAIGLFVWGSLVLRQPLLELTEELGLSLGESDPNLDAWLADGISVTASGEVLIPRLCTKDLDGRLNSVLDPIFESDKRARRIRIISKACVGIARASTDPKLAQLVSYLSKDMAVAFEVLRREIISANGLEEEIQTRFMNLFEAFFSSSKYMPEPEGTNCRGEIAGELKNLGIEVIRPKEGDHYDSRLHTSEGTELRTGGRTTIKAVLRPGFRDKLGSVLRTAGVVVQ